MARRFRGWPAEPSVTAHAGPRDCGARRPARPTSYAQPVLVDTSKTDVETQPSEALARLAADPDWFVRHYVASNSATPPDVLQRLASDAKWAVCGGVAQNIMAPTDLLLLLAADKDEIVRGWTASNDAIPADLLLRMSTDKSNFVRGGPPGTRRCLPTCSHDWHCAARSCPTDRQDLLDAASLPAMTTSTASLKDCRRDS